MKHNVARASALWLALAAPWATTHANDTAEITTANVTVGKALPLDIPLTFTVTSLRPGKNGGMLRFTATHKLLFKAAGRGLAVEKTLIDYHSDAPGAAGRAFAALLAPLKGRPVDLLIGDDGTVHLLDADALWQDIALDAAAQTTRDNRPEAAQVADMLLALPQAARAELLADEVRELLMFRGASISGSGATGGALLTGIAASRLTIMRNDASAGAPMATETAWIVDADSGIALSETQRIFAGAERALVSERIRTISPF